MQIKPTKITIIDENSKILTIAIADKDSEGWECSYVPGENINGCKYFGKQFSFIYKKQTGTCRSNSTLMNIYPRKTLELVQQEMYTFNVDNSPRLETQKVPQQKNG